jgi:hypothetical protein
MFSHDTVELQTNTVKIEDLKFEVFQEILRYIYCNKIENLETLGMSLYKAADKVIIENINSQFFKEIYLLIKFNHQFHNQFQ